MLTNREQHPPPSLKSLTNAPPARRGSNGNLGIQTRLCNSVAMMKQSDFRKAVVLEFWVLLTNTQ
eukprot:3803555-Amphidinium_carterae.1